MCWFLHSHDGSFIRLLQCTLKKVSKTSPKFHLHAVKSLISVSPLGFWFIVTSGSLCLWSLSPCACSCTGWECYHPLIPQSWTPRLDTFNSAAEICFVTHFILNQPVHLKWLRQRVTAGLADFKYVRKLSHSWQKWGGGGDTEQLEMETPPADLAAAKSWSVAMTIGC